MVTITISRFYSALSKYIIKITVGCHIYFDNYKIAGGIFYAYQNHVCIFTAIYSNVKAVPGAEIVLES